MSRFSVAEPADCVMIFDIDIARYDEQWKGENQIDELREELIDVFRRSPSLGFFYDGKPIGGVLYIGGEAHMAVLPEFHGRWGFLHKKMMDWLFAIKEPMYATIEIDNAKCVQFMDRCNWRRIKTTDKMITYEMRRREKPSRLG